VDALLERLPLVYAAAVVLTLFLPTARARALGGIGLCLIALAAAGDAVGGPGGGSEFTTANEVLASLGAAVVLAALVLVILRRLPSLPGGLWADSGKPAAPDTPDPPLLAGLLLAALGPHLLIVAAGALAALASAVRQVLRAERPLWLAPLLISGAFLGTGFALAFTILGPLGGGVAMLPTGPFSPAAERLLVMLMGGATMLMAGLPPLQRGPYGLALAPLGAVLMVRMLAAAFPGGLSDWQPLAMLLLVGSLAYAAFCGRWRLAAVAAGFLTLWSGQRNGELAGLILVCWGWVACAGGQVLARRGILLDSRWAGVPALIPSLAILPALIATLRSQVVLSVAAVLVVAIGLGWAVLRRAPSVPGPLY
jgi:hypothetical protein